MLYVICVLETWTSENNNNNYTLNNHTKPRYQKFCGAKGFFYNIYVTKVPRNKTVNNK